MPAPRTSRIRQNREKEKQHHVIVIDRSPIEVSRTEDGRIETVESTGGAGKVAVGDAAALLEAGHDVSVVAVAKSAYERELAQKGEPFAYQYGDNVLTLRFVHVPEKTYAMARDMFFSGHLWFWLQAQAHPEIMQQYSPDMWTAFQESNQCVTDVVEEVVKKDSTVWVHDGHVQLVGSQLRERNHRHLKLAFIGHTAWPHKEFVRNQLVDPISMPPSVVRDHIYSLCAYNLVNFSSRIWTENLRRSAALYGVRDLPRLSSVPVPLDAKFVSSQAKGSEAFAKELSLELGDRKLIICGGRAEWYKNIEKVIDSEVMRIKALPPTERQNTLTAIITSETRGVVPGYPEYHQSILKKIKTANAELGFEAFREVPGNDQTAKFAYMMLADVMITPATQEGYNLMALEQNVVDQKAAVHVGSRSMGLAHHLDTLGPQVPGSRCDGQFRDPRQPAMVEINPTVVKLSQNAEDRTREAALLELETFSMAMATAEALRTPEPIRQAMKAAMQEVTDSNTPHAHMRMLQSELGRARGLRQGALSQSLSSGL